ncbi:AAA family ATPase [Salmonella bongori]|uniref:AAA family ATPase n=1 Tax=Salmonella bongori TaxID=54736 RepID=UPI0009A97C78|nr:ATP-binding protein [Salmonella bongori]
MIEIIDSGDIRYEFIDKSLLNHDGSNIFTVMIGRNGTGKSRLLKDIVVAVSSEKQKKSANKIQYINYNKSGFSKVIALSTNPFDKFPLPRTIESNNKYYYIGIKDCGFRDVSNGFLRKILGSYLKAYLLGDRESLGKTLDYLGYEKTFNLKFSYIGGSIIERLTNEQIEINKQSVKSNKNYNLAWKLRYYLEERYKKGEYHLENFLFEAKKHPESEGHVTIILESLIRIPAIHRIRKISISINNNEVTVSNKKISFNNELINLIDAGILKLESAYLQKKGSKEIFKINDASSGEQCVILSMLGISSLISDNSLILIDEPEVCLHPEWQEKYIQLLTRVFNSYKYCQFIIATHSPQIIANLSTDQCFVLKMEDGVVHNANEFIHKSSDFQLATLFESPGYKNEYLSRLAVSLFSKITAERNIDSEDLEALNVLKKSLDMLSVDDPLYELINVIIKAGSVYGGDK